MMQTEVSLVVSRAEDLILNLVEQGFSKPRRRPGARLSLFLFTFQEALPTIR
jgi:hypothetical protein